MVYDQGFNELNKERENHSSFFIGNRLYVVGGRSDRYKQSVEYLDIGETDNPVCEKKWELICLNLKCGLCITSPLPACPVSPTQILILNYMRDTARLYLDLYDTTQPLVKKAKTVIQLITKKNRNANRPTQRVSAKNFHVA